MRDSEGVVKSVLRVGQGAAASQVRVPQGKALGLKREPARGDPRGARALLVSGLKGGR